MPTTPPESEIQLGSWTVTEEWARQYLSAVGDGQQAYFDHRLVPPLALTAGALGALLDKLALAPGAIHSLQECATLRSVGFGERITGVAQVERPRQRGGLAFTVASYLLTNSAGAPVQTGKTTVLVPPHGATGTLDV
jgi:acyl dehydratase